MKKVNGKPGNKWMANAKRNRNDEYYTRIEDIEKELAHYSGAFAGKSVHLCCDSPRASQFWNYFEARFVELGLTRLVATHYFHGKDTEAAILEMEEGRVVRRDVPLVDKGDFRSPECRAYMEAADVVVTNPPFTNIVEFVTMLDGIGVDYLIVAPSQAVTYKPILDLVMAGRCHAGVNRVSRFEVSPGEYKSVGALWLTTLAHGIKKSITPVEAPESDYQRYLNVDAIEVPEVKMIPKDYDGMMGVPYSFFVKWDSDEYEILGVTKSARLLNDDGSEHTAHARLLIRRRQSIEEDSAKIKADLASTCLSQAEFDKRSNVMTLTFKRSGSVYTYDGVARETYDELVHDKAPGRYFVYHVRNAGYKYKRVA